MLMQSLRARENSVNKSTNGLFSSDLLNFILCESKFRKLN